MERLQFNIAIKASAGKVYRTMLAPDTFQKWTAAVNPTSTYEGNWEKGSKMLFIGRDKEGNREGMISEVAENIHNEFVSIRHYGVVDRENEMTMGEEEDKWTGGFENYTFDENNGVTTLTVMFDTAPESIDYFNEAYPKALALLKEITER